MINAGTDIVIDYKKEDFTKNGLKYDYILDMAGHHPLLDYKRSLTVSGKYLLVGGSSSLIIKCIFLGPIISLWSKKKMKILAHEPNKYLRRLIELSDEGKLNPFIDSTYKLNEVPEAIHHFSKGLCQGKIIITVDR
jgi:NADPH:quinone reductase-like Zn-dependent oxidoreductase